MAVMACVLIASTDCFLVNRSQEVSCSNPKTIKKRYNSVCWLPFAVLFYLGLVKE